ncbi:MAG: MGDG synthase family glycosyltransferase [Desulfitobacteriia bacterium]|jgi:processive 1,2-diacylglycerol beta-glucosyltransferase
MKILFLPFLQIKTGHHTVADALISSLERRLTDVEYTKIDFLSYADKVLEKAFRFTYLTWIDHAPQSFNLLYRHFIYPSKSSKHFKWFEFKFLDKMRDLITEENPDLIVCTQALPSFLIDKLRLGGIATPPVINVYTDFFINKLWGLKGIDYHFVPNKEIRAELITKHQIKAENIFITGIPVDECFTPRPSYKPEPPYNILISGGNEGLGDMDNLISNLSENSDYSFTILCGKNKKLYKEVSSLQKNNIKPLSYISSRETMNLLYNKTDALITKPGGVTVSEALSKRIPIFVHSSLPGQERINKRYLFNQKLIYLLDPNQAVPDQLDQFFKSQNEHKLWRNRVDSYFEQIEGPAWQKIIDILTQLPVKTKSLSEEVSLSCGTR